MKARSYQAIKTGHCIIAFWNISNLAEVSSHDYKDYTLGLTELSFMDSKTICSDKRFLVCDYKDRGSIIWEKEHEYYCSIIIVIFTIEFVFYLI